MASIELHCSICPKDPTFSDQSHLLTHIGSKGHLSHYFKAQVRAREDGFVRTRLQAYDGWYARNNIEELLSQRLKAKDSKKDNRRTASTGNVTATSKKVTRKKPAVRRDSTEAESPVKAEPIIDPSLQNHHFLPTPVALGRLAPVTPLRPSAGHGIRAPVARMQVTPESGQTPPLDISLMHRSIAPRISQEQAALLDSATVHKHQRTFTTSAQQPRLEPSPLRSVSTPILSSSARSASIGAISDNLMDTPKADSQHTDISVSECARLKGVIWPGMHLFDTADEGSRRRRNQKKDISTLVQMQTESESFEPTENIYFYPSWDFKKARFISGEVDSSPPTTPEPVPIRTRRKRAVLADLDTNVPNAKKRRGRKASGPLLRSDTNPGQTDQYDEDEYELQLTQGHRPRKSARGFSVFNDKPFKEESRTKESSSAVRPLQSPFLTGEEIRNHCQTGKAGPYFGQLHQPQPRISENTSFLHFEGTRGRGEMGIQYHHGLNLGPQSSKVARTNSNDSIIDESVHYANQRYFSTEPNEPPQLHTMMPQYMDMKLSYGYQATNQTSNPLHSSLSDIHHYQESSQQFPGLNMETSPVAHRQLCGKEASRRSSISSTSSSDETIDQSLEVGSMFFDH